jgi:hypothetical protein
MRLCGVDYVTIEGIHYPIHQLGFSITGVGTQVIEPDADDHVIIVLVAVSQGDGAVQTFNFNNTLNCRTFGIMVPLSNGIEECPFFITRTGENLVFANTPSTDSSINFFLRWISVPAIYGVGEESESESESDGGEYEVASAMAPTESQNLLETRADAAIPDGFTTKKPSLWRRALDRIIRVCKRLIGFRS